MNIALDMVSAKHGGGFKTYNKNILNQLIQDNHFDDNYFIFINDKNFTSNNKNIKFIYVHNFFSIASTRIIWMQVVLPLFLIYYRIQILFSPMNILPLISTLTKIKTVLVVHSNLPWLFPADMPGNKIKFLLQRKLMDFSIKLSDKIIVDSITAKTELDNIFKKIKNKTNVVYLGVEKSIDLNKKFNIVIKNLDIYNEPYFLTISSAVRYHCIIELITAYDLLCKENNAIPKYLIISKNLDSKYFKKVKETIRNSNYSDKIILLENIESNFIPTLYKNSQLYIFSSYCEVFGLTNIEAMNYQVPVLTANKSALPEICDNAAIYFNPFDSNDIKNKIMDLFFNNDKKNNLIENGIIRAKNFSWFSTYSKTKQIILDNI